MYYVFFILLLTFTLLFGSIYSNSYGSSINNSNITNNNTVLQASNPIPTVEKLSENKYYLIQLKSSGFTPGLGTPLQIIFLNAKNPDIQNFGFPNEDQQNTPSVLYNIIPVISYDITIYGDKGNVLWEKDNRSIEGIGGTHFVTLQGYEGNVTIAIDNIIMKPRYANQILEPTTSNNTSNEKTLKDSVKFNAFVKDNIISVKPSKTEFTIDPY